MEVIFILNEIEYNFFNDIDNKDPNNAYNNKTNYLIDRIIHKGYVSQIARHEHYCRLCAFYNNSLIFNGSTGSFDYQHSECDKVFTEMIILTDDIAKKPAVL